MPDGTKGSPEDPAQPKPADRAAEPDRTQPDRTQPDRTGAGPADREPVLPNRAKEDRDVGWGEIPREQDDWYERERPPHHGT